MSIFEQVNGSGNRARWSIGLLLYFPLTGLFAETEVHAVYGRMNGSYIRESRSHDFSDNRLSYGHTGPFFGLEGTLSTRKWEILGRLQTSGGGANSEHVQDKDLDFQSVYVSAQRRGPRIDRNTGALRDQANTSGLIDLISADGQARFRERSARLAFFYLLSASWSIGLQAMYTYSAYQLMPLWVSSSWYPERGWDPLYRTGLFESNLYELQAGLRYRKNAGPLRVGFQLLPGAGRILGRDTQLWRMDVQKPKAEGFSSMAIVSLSYVLGNAIITGGIYGHRTRADGHTTVLKDWNGLRVPVREGAILDLQETGTEISLGYVF